MEIKPSNVFVNPNVSSDSKDSNAIWNHVPEVNNRKKTSSNNQPSELIINYEPVTDSKVTATERNLFFSPISNKTIIMTKCRHLKISDYVILSTIKSLGIHILTIPLVNKFYHKSINLILLKLQL